MSSSTCGTDNCSSNVSMEKLIEGDAPIEYCEDCYQKDQDENHEEEVIRRECFKCDKIYYDVDYSCCCGKCCSYCRESDKKEDEADDKMDVDEE